MTADTDAREATELHADLRARIAAHVVPTFRHSGDPDPHPDEDALVERLTNAVLPLEVGLRAVLDRLKQLEQERDGDVRAVDAYLLTAALVGEQAAIKGDPFLSLRAHFIGRIAEQEVADRIAELAARDEQGAEDCGNCGCVGCRQCDPRETLGAAR